MGAVVGSYLDDDNGGNSGVAFIYSNITPSSIPTTSYSSPKYSSIRTEFGFNNVTIVTNSASSFQFSFTNTIPGSMIHAAIVAPTLCNSTNSAFQIKHGGTAGAIVGPVVMNSTIATLTKNIESEIDVADKNSGKVVLNYCLRADLYDDANPSVSVGAKKSQYPAGDRL